MRVRTFFKCPAATTQPGTECAPADADLPFSRQELDHFIERYVPAIIDHFDNKRLVSVQNGRSFPTPWPRCWLALYCSCNPAGRRGNPNPKRPAAWRADIPVADAFKTRIRRSSLSARAIINLLFEEIESPSIALVTSRSIHQSQDLL